MTETAQHPVEALRQAYIAVTGYGRSEDMLSLFLRAGVTVERVEHVGRLAQHAIAVGAAVATVRMNFDAEGTDEHLTGSRILTAVIAGIEHGAAIDTAMAWAAVLAAETDAEQMEPMLFDIGALARAAEPAGTLGPLAYAAGLTPVATRARAHAGTLVAEDLRILAGLRGDHLPD